MQRKACMQMRIIAHGRKKGLATEIERKFLVVDDSWRENVSQSFRIAQGYLAIGDKSVTRVRIKGEDEAFLTIKGKTEGISRQEFEYRIPVEDAEALLKLCTGGVIDKHRHIIREGETVFELDTFSGDNEGLIVAEVELASETSPFARPTWLGDEVSDDPRYFNAALSKKPFKTW